MKFSFFAKLIGLLIVGLLEVFVVDPLDPSTVSTPFLLGIILMAISLRQSPPLVIAVSIIYSGLTAYALITFHEYIVTRIHFDPHPYFWLFQRMGLFLVVCAMAIYLAYYRTATERTRSHLQDILSKLPAPVVISDASGFIVYTNDTLSTLFKQSATEIIGRRYVDLFMGDIQEGKAMRYYIEVFSGQDKSVHEMGIRPFGGPIQMTARLICLGAGSNRVLITLLSNPEEVSQTVSSQ